MNSPIASWSLPNLSTVSGTFTPVVVAKPGVGDSIIKVTFSVTGVVMQAVPMLTPKPLRTPVGGGAWKYPLGIPGFGVTLNAGAFPGGTATLTATVTTKGGATLALPPLRLYTTPQPVTAVAPIATQLPPIVDGQDIALPAGHFQLPQIKGINNTRPIWIRGVPGTVLTVAPGSTSFYGARIGINGCTLNMAGGKLNGTGGFRTRNCLVVDSNALTGPINYFNFPELIHEDTLFSHMWSGPAGAQLYRTQADTLLGRGCANPPVALDHIISNLDGVKGLALSGEHPNIAAYFNGQYSGGYSIISSFNTIGAYVIVQPNLLATVQTGDGTVSDSYFEFLIRATPGSGNGGGAKSQWQGKNSNVQLVADSDQLWITRPNLVPPFTASAVEFSGDWAVGQNFQSVPGLSWTGKAHLQPGPPVVFPADFGGAIRPP